MAKRFANLIGGAWVEAADVSENRNPSDLDEVVGEFSQGSAADVDAAVAAARAALPGWSKSNAQVRGDLLHKVHDLLMARSADIGELLAREEGKTLAEGVGEVQRAARIFQFYAGECYRAIGDVLPSMRSGVSVEAWREPIGVVGLITPWNFPIAIPAWKTAPALAYGNTVVMKPADLVPASAWRLAEIIKEAGAPDGVFNLVMGRGSVVGEAMLTHKGVDGISFTGSQNIGARVAEACASRFRRFQLEMGGKNPLVVLDDADVDLAVEGALNGAFFATGQRCTASSRLVVTKGVYQQFVDQLAARLGQINVGHALDPKTNIGPVVSSAQLNQNLEYVEAGKAEGARLVSGGERLERPTKGYFMQPALFADVDNSMRIAREEIFGPVLSVLTFRTVEEAIEKANNTAYGLSAGVWTDKGSRILKMSTELKAGVVWANTYNKFDPTSPFGGYKESGFGREGGRQGLLDYCKLVCSP